MLANKHKINHETIVHQKIWNIISNVIPLSESLTDDYIQNIGEEMVESCKDYYAFYTDMLYDMYNNPNEYYLNAGMYEKTLNGRKYYAVKRSKGDNAVKKCPTDLQRSFFLFLINIGTYGEISEDTLIFKKILFDKLVKQSVKNKDKDYLIKKPIERVYMLERVGLRIQYIDDWVRVINDKYPKMFPALCDLAKNTTEDDFQSCPLKAITKAFIPNYICAVRMMSDDEKNIVDEISEHIKKYKIKINYGFGDITWLMKGKPFISIGYKAPGPFLAPVFTIIIKGIYNWNDPSYYIAALENTSEELKKYFLRNLQYCQVCSPRGPCPNHYNIFGETKRLCGGSCSISDKKPQKENLPFIKQIIDVRIKIAKDGTDNIHV